MKANFNLFRNNHKEKDTHPDYRGDGKLDDGRPVRVSAWAKRTQKGDTYLSCVVELDEYRMRQEAAVGLPAGTASLPPSAVQRATATFKAAGIDVAPKQDDLPF